MRMLKARFGLTQMTSPQLLGHRLQGSGTDELGGEVMTSRYSHGGYGWNQQLRYAVTLLHTALLSYGRLSDESTSEVKVANSRKDEGKVGWSQRDLNPCFNATATSPLIFESFDDFLQVRKGRD